ncbi:MAG: hypothetical protein AB8B84_04125 [Granulosicoccus sp.]
MFWQFLLVGLFGLLFGLWLGGKRGRAVQREALNELNTKSLEMLEFKSRVNALKAEAAEADRNERMLQKALRQLHESKEQVKILRQLMITQSKKHYIDESYLRLKAVKSHENAVKAASLARKATAQIKLWESALPAIKAIKQTNDELIERNALQTIEVFEDRGVSDAQDVVRRVSNRDSRRLAKLKSSNEASGPAS